MDIFPWMKGFGSEGSVLNLLLSAFILWHVFIKPKMMKKQGKDRRKVSNPSVKPGDSIVCKENRDKIIALETSVKDIKNDIVEIKDNNREDHEKIFDKIDKIKR